MAHGRYATPKARCCSYHSHAWRPSISRARVRSHLTRRDRRERDRRRIRASARPRARDRLQERVHNEGTSRFETVSRPASNSGVIRPWLAVFVRSQRAPAGEAPQEARHDRSELVSNAHRIVDPPVCWLPPRRRAGRRLRRRCKSVTAPVRESRRKFRGYSRCTGRFGRNDDRDRRGEPNRRTASYCSVSRQIEPHLDLESWTCLRLLARDRAPLRARIAMHDPVRFVRSQWNPYQTSTTNRTV